MNEALEREEVPSEVNLIAHQPIPEVPLRNLANRVACKLEEGDFRGAVRLVSSTTSFCPTDERTLRLLKEKHPPSHPDTICPPFQSSSSTLQVTSSLVLKAISSFPAGSAGGPDGLRPQHLKDLTMNREASDVELIDALTEFVNLILCGEILPAARPFFFGASLTALPKLDAGVRPIAVGCTLRRLVAKCAAFLVKDDMGSLLFPSQLGYGTPRGAEGAVHAARIYLSSLESGKLLLKLDFSNAFNTIRRDKMLSSTLAKSPGIFPFVHSAYSQSSILFFGDNIIESSEGVQQGDPLGPLLFCLSIHDMVSRIKSEFKVFYLDDGTLGGTVDDVLEDLNAIETAAGELGLSLNHAKSEIFCADNSTEAEMLDKNPDLLVVNSDNACLLGSPIGGMASINSILQTKIQSLEVFKRNLTTLHSHDALCLLRHAFSLPKVLYVLRTAPCFCSSLLSDFDVIQRSLLESICNIQLSERSWLQASLPVNSGGLGIRSAVMLAPSAYLASAAGSSCIIRSVLPTHLSDALYPFHEEALQLWRGYHDQAPPESTTATQQKQWDLPVVEASFQTLLRNADAKSSARLLAAREKESGSWLTAPPISSVGLRLDDEVVRVAVGLRLGSPLCIEHHCLHCGQLVDTSGTHGLSCRRSKGRIPRHSALNELVKRSLTSIRVPSMLEPMGLFRSDGRRPDGITVIPWSRGKALVWDVTCHDSFAPSNLPFSSTKAGAVADRAASSKCRLYEELCLSHCFVPIAIESTGVFSRDAAMFFRDLANRSRTQTDDSQAYLKLCQQISVTVQRFNCTAVLGSND